MPDQSTNSTVINRTNSGFPDYLDFDALRTSSIQYLSSLTGKLWTDYNVHDPGITILEVLLYALLDLGYRTNLPAIDIFTKNPADLSCENNFFTPAEILTCNPLTVTDFRKLLIDIDGVKNAWLKVAEDISLTNICEPHSTDAGNVTASGDSTANPCKNFINGLYHIKLQLEDAPVRLREDVIQDVKKALLSHRNLCEDFIDISVLCSLPVGICADIALDSNADAAEVYRDIVVALQVFFSPSPIFYTLRQLLQKNKKIDEIFAGRPYNHYNSQGFVDTSEFEAITLKEEIHLSDVYNIILGVPGVATVRKLKLTRDGVHFSDKWLFTIPADYVTIFSTLISSLQFSINGITVPVNFQQNNLSLKVHSVNTSKLQQPTQNLNLAIPQGSYHNDLAAYYSIQNEFPLVYGIGEGGVPDSAPAKRRAQALQLKGYLLFFDQLLSNYLSQLGNIREIFSFQFPPSKSAPHTYFSSELTTVPGLQQLYQNVADKHGKSNAGVNGAVIGWPVNKQYFEAMIRTSSFSSSDVNKLQQQYSAGSADQYNITTALLQEDFKNELFKISDIVTTADGYALFYIETSSDDTLVTGELFLKDKDEANPLQLQNARNQLKLLTNIATLADSYNILSSFNFTIALNLHQYVDYLSQIVEDKNLYRNRRENFLDHLLARFAEQFTDFAMLSFNFSNKELLADVNIKNKENFLSQYPTLSSNRGKASDYRDSNKNEISGFEKRFRAYTGIDGSTDTSLCNFEVIAYDSTYSVQLILADEVLFNTAVIYEGSENAQQGLQAIFSSLPDAHNYQVEYIAHQEKYQLQLFFNGNEKAYYPGLFNDEKSAAELAGNLQKISVPGFNDETIVESGYVFRLQLTDSKGNIIRLSENSFNTEEEAYASAVAYLRTPNDIAKWQIILPEENPSGKFCCNDKKKPAKLVDIDAFNIDLNNNIVGQPDKFSFELLDNSHAFKFKSLKEFSSEKQAKSNAYQVLMLMVDKKNFQFTNDKKKKIFIVSNGQPVAECLNKIENTIKGEEFIDKVWSIVNNHYYLLSVPAFANKWKIRYQLGFETDRILLFESDEEFNSFKNAKTAAQQFIDSLQTVQLEIINLKYSLKNAGNTIGTLTCIHVGAGVEAMPEDEKLSKAKQLLELNKEIQRRLCVDANEPFTNGIEIDALSHTGPYVYRLVDNDNLLAQHNVAIGNDSKAIVKQLYTNSLAGYTVLDICLGGDISEPCQDEKSKTVLYRYVVRCHNQFKPFKTDSILFKSVATYNTAMEAEVAFNDIYLEILKKAMVADNYGAGKYISLDEPSLMTGDFDKKSPVEVFVPSDTQALVQETGRELIKTMTETVKTYPVKILEACSDEYKNLFPGKAGDCPSTAADNCINTPAQSLYYFSLYNVNSGSYDWQSVNIYNTAQDARQAFYFFRMLLKYKGNYFIDNLSDDGAAIFIREVLAESKARFKDETAAWGTAGVEKFICIAQASGTFHGGVNSNNSSYTFNVGCDTANAVHPCKYESATKRDEVLEKLFAAFKNFDTTRLFKIINEEERELLYGIDGKPIAILYKYDETNNTDCERILDLLQRAGNYNNYDVEDSKLIIKNGDKKIAEVVDENATKASWKKELLMLAWYFPIQPVNGKFYIQIRLPGFNTPDNIENRNSDGCIIPAKNSCDDCYLAWQSYCGYEDCSTAMSKYEMINGLLADYTNYQPYFGPDCYSFGIALLQPADIVAFCPQQYEYFETMFDALERSKKIINREGVFLIEHILLRPRTQNDGGCKYIRPGNFFTQTKCSGLTWKDDVFVKGIEQESDVCFTPGEDPFSFIATVALPAWPERFRKKENRDLLEMILQREAPAHILLRILWLTPFDTSRFEKPYKVWKFNLLQNNTAHNTAAINLMEVLFRYKLDTLSDCVDCLPCSGAATSLPCVDDTNDQIKKSEGIDWWLNEINDLFQWNKEAILPAGNNLLPVAAEVPVVLAPPLAINKDQVRFINARLQVYKDNIAGLFANSNENELAGRANYIFGEKNLPDKINELLAALTNNDISEAASLNLFQKDELIKNLLEYYLDGIFFQENTIAGIDLITAGLNSLRQNNFNLQKLFDDWNPAKNSSYPFEADTDEVRKIILKENT